jgi:hypothetical protein
MNKIFSVTRQLLEFLKKAPETGAAAVEFALALLALMVFFGIYMQFVQIFIAHDRSIFAGFTAARTYAVRGEPPAISAAVAVDPDSSVDITNGEVVIKRHVPIPAGLDRFLTQGQGRFTVIHRSPALREPQLNDDNPFPF